ncbi:MAG: hypothetical protein G01um101431_30 [Parcubacteria group bacterium Gr01-1014_31]|nr:MAG: hypothetical protein G01um101431_30 [Parcubacteria group bacterium Gr01-1014_31]
MGYLCTECGYSTEHPGHCPECELLLQEICETCGQLLAECECDD